MAASRENAGMSLSEALKLANQPVGAEVPRRATHLLCGFTPLHLSTYLKAHGRIRFPKSGIEIELGLFDDLIGSIGRIEPASELAVVLEWFDLDPRLGLRSSGGWSHKLFPDMEQEVAGRLKRLVEVIRRTSEHSVIAIAGPTLPLPPIDFTRPSQDSGFEARLGSLVDSAMAELASIGNVKLLSQQELAICSPLDTRLDVGLTLNAGFPYTLAHTDILARMLINLLFPLPPRKGLITDLDDTLWLGILGEVGVENVSWSLEAHSQIYGLYQQYLAALADRGVLLGIASKNDTKLAEAALARTDLLCAGSKFYPIECNWSAKSAFIGRILKAWNIGPSDVVFIDDNSMELAEVSKAFPEIACLQFPGKDLAGFWKLLQQLRKLFGCREMQDEDRLRTDSIRTGAAVQQEKESLSEDDFIQQLKGEITLDHSKSTENTRAFELINKTNQFNLNGRRMTEAEWIKLMQSPEDFLVTVSYRDKFGPLGRIAVLTGKMEGSTLHIRTWVMSCRAFSRRIEHQVFAQLISGWSPERIELDFLPTERNTPTQDFLKSIVESLSRHTIVLNPEEFKKRCPPLFHEVKETGIEQAASAIKSGSPDVTRQFPQ
jgi:FkbH-like protein